MSLNPNSKLRGQLPVQAPPGISLTSPNALNVHLRPKPAAALLFDMDTGRVLWQARLGTSVQGFPVSFTADGHQYVAVTTGLGGGSPRQVPATILPEIEVPNTGQALYVFKLRDKR